MLEGFFRPTHGRLAALTTVAATERSSIRRIAFARTSAEAAVSQASRAQRLALYEQVEQRRGGAQSITQIARELGMSRGGMRTVYYAESFPERARHAVPPRLLDPYLP